jgi:sugar fermentation stimulation protein A
VAEIEGKAAEIHVADPGRLRELLYPGNSVLLKAAPRNSHRKTSWSLIAGMGESGWVLLNTFLHRRIAENILADPQVSPFGRLRGWRAEVTPQGCTSRFDFLLEPEGSCPVWLEVKGCSLKAGERALFPDAPTTRGARHLRELGELSANGCRCAVMFLVFPAEVVCFAPNGATDPDFEQAFRDSMDMGVSVHPVHLSFTGSQVTYSGILPLCRGY